MINIINTKYKSLAETHSPITALALRVLHASGQTVVIDSDGHIRERQHDVRRYLESPGTRRNTRFTSQFIDLTDAAAGRVNDSTHCAADPFEYDGAK